MLIRLRRCAGWFASLLFAYGINRFSHDVAPTRLETCTIVCVQRSGGSSKTTTCCLCEPQHDKTNKMACAPSDHSDQPGHPPSLIRVFIVCIKKPWVLIYPLSAHRRLWSDWADAWLILIILVLSCCGSYCFSLPHSTGRHHSNFSVLECPVRIMACQRHRCGVWRMSVP